MQRRALINLVENFQEKQNINFQKTKLILNSIFYKELKVYNSNLFRFNIKRIKKINK